MTAKPPVCDRSELRDKNAKQDASKNVAGPVLGQVHAGHDHERDTRDRDPLRDAGDAGEEGDSSGVAARERAGEGHVGERDELDGPRQLPGRDRLRDQRLQRYLDRGDDDQQERDPGVALPAPQARDGKAERDAARDLRLAEQADEGGEEVEPWGAHRLNEVDQRPVDLTQRAGGDERAQRDETRRDDRDPDQR